MTPHVSQNVNRNGGSAIDGRTTRHAGYEISQRIRKRIEEPFGWIKQIGGFRQTKQRGRERVRQEFLKVMAAYNLVRLRKHTVPAQRIHRDIEQFRNIGNANQKQNLNDVSDPAITNPAFSASC